MKRKFLVIGGLILLSLLPVRHLFFPGYFPMDDNTQIMRLYQLAGCLKDGQFPCRLIPLLGNGYSFPLFNFYSPFVYYLGVFLKLFNLSYVFIAKLLFGLSFLLSALSFWWLVKKVFKLGFYSSLTATAFYLWAPYRAVDIYVRGDLAESWIFVFLPLIFGILYQLANKKTIKTKTLIVYNLTIAAFLLTHTVSLITLFLPFLVWLIFLFIASTNKARFFKRLLLLLPSVGLSAFYLLPAILEKNLVTTETMFTGYFNFANHFVSLKQLFFSRFWGYGGSNVLDNDTMSFQLGWPMWWFVALALTFTISQTLLYFKRQNLKPSSLKIGIWNLIVNCKLKIENYPLVILALYLISIFLTHAKSYYIWQALPFLSYLQFPWRFLLPAVFFQALIAGLVINKISASAIKKWLALAAVASAIILNFSYFRPEAWWPNFNDKSFFAKTYFKKQQQAIINDYLPKTVKQIPEVGQFKKPQAIAGKANIKQWQLRSNYWQFITETSDNTKILVPVFDFPTWQAVVDGKPVPHQIDPQYGFIVIGNINEGKHIIRGYFINTPIRTTANAVSILALITLLGLSIKPSVKPKTRG
ncbi:MAG: YfhO family protein [bacterium]|nr:YfhO family protein [bacterium]